MSEPNGEAHGRLIQFLKDWKDAQRRAEQAQQTAQAASADAAAKEIRFKGAAELLHGPDVTWEFTEADGLRFTQPNRKTRRALVKVRKRK